MSSLGRGLTIDGVSKRFGGVRALRHVSFRAEAGRVTGLIGPNGAGKTTLFNIITGFDSSDEGVVRYGGTVLTGRTPQAIAHLGVVRTFQDVRIFARLTALENLAVAAGTRDDLDLAREFLSEVGRATGTPLPLGAAAGALSFGNQKIVALARCIAAGATALLLDEPVAALHDVGREVVAALVRAFQKDGSLVLLIEHDMRFVMSNCDDMFVIAEGQLIASGTPSEIRANRDVIDAYLGGRRAES